jgi:hypothetical protein
MRPPLALSTGGVAAGTVAECSTASHAHFASAVEMFDNLVESPDLPLRTLHANHGMTTTEDLMLKPTPLP